jgi:heat shock protein HslJ
MRIGMIASALGLLLITSACVGGSSPPKTTRLSPAPAGLTGTVWTARSIDEKAVTLPTPPTMVFQAGQVSGTDGCNRYSGPYTESANSIHFGSISMTDMACMGQVSEVAASFGESLSGEVSFILEGVTLTLTNNTGSTQLSSGS